MAAVNSIILGMIALMTLSEGIITEDHSLDTEKACFISHAMLWEECLRTAQPVLIFEDDQMINSSFSALLPYLSGLANQYGVIRLEGVGRGDYKVIDNIQGCDLVEWDLGQYMSGGYTLSPQAANILLNKCHDIIFPVDNFMDMYWWHGVRHISFYPFVCTDENIASTIRDADYVSKLNLDKANENVWYRLVSAMVRFFYKRRVDCYKMYSRLLKKPVINFKW